MLELALILLATFLCGVGIVVILYGLLLNKMKATKWGFLLFATSVAFGTVSSYFLADSLIDRIAGVFRFSEEDRTDFEQYERVFGSASYCTEVIHYRDPQVPVIDDVIYVEIQCCPKEILRLTKGQSVSSSEDLQHTGPTPDWFNPLSLGEGAHKIYSTNVYGSDQRTLLVNRDSSHAFIASYGH